MCTKNFSNSQMAMINSCQNMLQAKVAAIQVIADRLSITNVGVLTGRENFFRYIDERQEFKEYAGNILQEVVDALPANFPKEDVQELRESCVIFMNGNFYIAHQNSHRTIIKDNYAIVSIPRRYECE